MPPSSTTLDVAFREAINRPSIAREFFLPESRASWEGDRYTLGRGDRVGVTPTITGLRFQEPDPNKVDPYRERMVQEDMARLVRSLAELRKTPALAGTVLSGECLVGRDAGSSGCKRAIFGLTCPADGRFNSDADAAAECHRQLVHALSRAGFRPVPGAPFDPRTGMKGLQEWANTVRLERAGFDKRWLLLLLLLLPLLLFLIPWRCDKKTDPQPRDQPPSSTFFGMDVKTESFLILVDKSGSMQPYFKQILAEAKRLLAECLKRGEGKTFVNVIVYDQSATSVLGKLEPLTSQVEGKLCGYLDGMRPGGGTNLASAIALATDEVKKHGKQTTVLVLTDGEDPTIQGLIRDKDRIKADAGAAIIINSTTPRLFDGKGDPKPANGWETGLTSLSQAFGGRFGPNPER